MGITSIERIEDGGALERLATEWDALLARSRADSIFLSWDCYPPGGSGTRRTGVSIGFVYTAFALEYAVSKGFTEFDFLQGAEEYKYRWTSTEPKETIESAREKTNFRETAS